MPLAIQVDNGPPFISTRARGGLTHLMAWLVSLGIRLVRSRIASPQDNGGHERMHRDLSELELTPAPGVTNRTPREPTDMSIRNWLRQADFDTGRRTDGLTTEEKQELARLRTV